MGPWLATIARRSAIDLHHSGKAQGRRWSPWRRMIPAAHDAFRSRQELGTVWEVRRAVEELPPEEQEVVRLQRFEGLTHEEITRPLEIPAGTVKSRSFRAHKRLGERLREAWLP